jgi:hypothetical protein
MKFRGKLGNLFKFSNFYSKNILIKGALGAPEGHQVDTRFVLGQKIRNRKQSVHHRKALEIWRIMVFVFLKIGSQDQKI